MCQYFLDNNAISDEKSQTPFQQIFQIVRQIFSLEYELFLLVEHYFIVVLERKVRRDHVVQNDAERPYGRGSWIETVMQQVFGRLVKVGATKYSHGLVASSDRHAVAFRHRHTVAMLTNMVVVVYRRMMRVIRVM